MPNMSYCRFRNTLRDLQDCASTIEDMARGEAPPLSKDEREAFVGLLRTMGSVLEIVCSEGGVEEEQAMELVTECHDVSLESIVDRIQSCAEAGRKEEEL